MNDIQAALDSAQRALAAAGIANARAEARWLLAEVLTVPGSALHSRSVLCPADRRRFEALIERRCAREPLQHLLGRAAFRYLDLFVGPGVFVPRPETELLVDLVLRRIAPVDEPVVVDLCSGSGAIGLAVAVELPRARVTLLERSDAALTWLRRNVADQARAVRERIEVVQADVATAAGHHALVPQLGTVDVVVANPPYVPANAEVGPEVAHDPPEAVFGGAEGLDLFPALVELAGKLLRPEGQLLLEHDETQAEALAMHLAARGWHDVNGVPDLTGRPRFVTALRPPR